MAVCVDDTLSSGDSDFEILTGRKPKIDEERDGYFLAQTEYARAIKN